MPSPANNYFPKSLSAHGFHRVVYRQWGDPENAQARRRLRVHGLTRNGRDFDALAAADLGSLSSDLSSICRRGDSEWLR